MTDAEPVCQVTITAPDAEWLAVFVRELVEDRLAACAHVTTAVRSIYSWQGEMFDLDEALATLHTRQSLVAAIVRRADERHPFDVPGVAAVPFVGGGPAYLDWIRSETAPAGVDSEDATDE